MFRMKYFYMSLLEKAYLIQTFNEYLANQVWISNNNKRILSFVQKIGHHIWNFTLATG